jgi:hypothetical protein
MVVGLMREQVGCHPDIPDDQPELREEHLNRAGREKQNLFRPFSNFFSIVVRACYRLTWYF